jgi:hypothetical protein
MWWNWYWMWKKVKIQELQALSVHVTDRTGRSENRPMIRINTKNAVTGTGAGGGKVGDICSADLFQ